MRPMHTMTRPARALLLAAALLAVGAAARAADGDGAVVVTGPAGPMTRMEVEVMARDLVPPADQARFWASPDNVAQFARSLYTQRLLAADALKAGVGTDPRGEAYLKLLRERGLAELLLRQRERATVPDAKALDAYARSEYQAHPEQFRLPEEVHARHILLAVAKDGSDDAAVKARAEKLMAELRGGADFATLAREQSADKGSAARGGDLGMFARGKMVPEFDQAVFALRKPGELAGPVKTQFGYHVIQLVERKPGEVRSCDQVLPELREQLRAKREANERRAVWDGAQGKAQVDEAAVKSLSADRRAAAAAKP